MLRRRNVLGFALAPLPILAPFLLFFAVKAAGEGDAGIFFAQIAPALTMIGYIAMLLIGLPTHLVLRWSGRTSLWAYLGLTVALIVLGFLGLSLFFCTSWSPRWGPIPTRTGLVFSCGAREGVKCALALALLALPCAWLFWIVAVRPSRT